MDDYKLSFDMHIQQRKLSGIGNAFTPHSSTLLVCAIELVIHYPLLVSRENYG